MSSLLAASDASGSPAGAGAGASRSSRRSTSSGGRCARSRSCVVDLETTGGSAAGGLVDHRDRRGQGPRRRGARRVPDAGPPERADPAVHLGADRHHQRDGRRRPPDRVGAAGLPGVRARHACWSRTTPRSTSASSSTTPTQQGLPWPRFDVLDTAKLARRVVTRDDAPNCKLSSLARLFSSTTTPNHRALSDARATVDVLHGLMERLGNLGVHTLEELSDLLVAGLDGAAQEAPPGRAAAARARASTCSATPRTGCSTSARRRTCAPGSAPTSPPARRAPGWARWSAWPTLGRGHHLRHAARGRGPRAAPDRRAQAALQPALEVPRAGQLGQAHRRAWPRLSLVKQVLDDGADYLGPFRSRSTAEAAMAALHESFPIRQCSDAAAPAPEPQRRASSPRWVVACRRATARSSVDDYTVTVEALRAAARARPAEVVDAAIRGGWTRWPPTERFEEAASHRNRMTSFIRAAARSQRLRALTGCAEIVAARRDRPRPLGGPRDPARSARRRRRHPAGRQCTRAGPTQLRLSAETVLPGPGPAPAATAEESEKILRWLEHAGRPAGHRRRHLVVPGGRRGVAARVPRLRSRPPASRWSRSTRPGSRARSHSLSADLETAPLPGNQPSDTTSWTAGIEGDPVRLVE